VVKEFSNSSFIFIFFVAFEIVFKEVYVLFLSFLRVIGKCPSNGTDIKTTKTEGHTCGGLLILCFDIFII